MLRPSASAVARGRPDPPQTERVMPVCPEHPGSRVRVYRTHGPSGPGVYPQCVPVHGRPHLLSWEHARPRSAEPVRQSLLSVHEVLVLEDAAEGLTVAESALRRHKSGETVKSQRRSILAKLGAKNMTHAVAITSASGLLLRRRAA
jgi:DNA-binding CsgD family transcriptional regulator